jgi:hypothetical protein
LLTYKLEEVLIEFLCVQPVVTDAERILSDQIIGERTVVMQQINRLAVSLTLLQPVKQFL